MGDISKSGGFIKDGCIVVGAGTVCIWRPLPGLKPLKGNEGFVLKTTVCDDISLRRASDVLLGLAVSNMKLVYGVEPKPYDFICAQYLHDGELEFTFAPSCLDVLMYGESHFKTSPVMSVELNDVEFSCDDCGSVAPLTLDPDLINAWPKCCNRAMRLGLITFNESKQ